MRAAALVLLLLTVPSLAHAQDTRAGWTHGVAVGLLGGAGCALANGVAFGALAATSGFGRPPCGSDCGAGFYPDMFFGIAMASAASFLALVVFSIVLATEGPGLEGVTLRVGPGSLGVDLSF